MGRVVRVEVVQSFIREQRLQRRCTVCERRRLTTRQLWRVDGKKQEARVCNDCLTATPPWPVAS